MKSSSKYKLGIVIIVVLGLMAVMYFAYKPVVRKIRRANMPVLEQDSSGNFALYVSNGSSTIPSVDILVLIDGKLAVDEDFHIGQIGMSNHKEFKFNLPSGRHNISAKSAAGSAELNLEFDITSKQWAILDYSYNPESEYEREKSFIFNIQDEPIYFR